MQGKDAVIDKAVSVGLNSRTKLLNLCIRHGVCMKHQCRVGFAGLGAVAPSPAYGIEYKSTPLIGRRTKAVRHTLYPVCCQCLKRISIIGVSGRHEDVSIDPKLCAWSPAVLFPSLRLLKLNSGKLREIIKRKKSVALSLIHMRITVQGSHPACIQAALKEALILFLV